MIYPLVRELAVDGIAVTVTCRVLNIARQPYYRWLAAPITISELIQAHRANALFDAHRDDPEFGYRLLVDEAAAGGQPMASAPPGRSVRPTAGGARSASRAGARAVVPDRRCTTTGSTGCSPPQRPTSCG
jgi:hypothetical protein